MACAGDSLVGGEEFDYRILNSSTEVKDVGNRILDSGIEVKAIAGGAHLGGEDFENRIVTVRTPQATVASVYVPNGGKDFPAKVRFLDALDRYAETLQTAGRTAVLTIALVPSKRITEGVMRSLSALGMICGFP